MSCGCNSNTFDSEDSCNGSADCAEFPTMEMPKIPCGINTQKGDLKRYAMVEVRVNGSSNNASSPSTGSSGSSTSNSQCPSNAAPFYSSTTDDLVTVPGVGGLFVITVCNASLWFPGMWVSHPLGDFPIISRDTVNNTLTLRNSCDDNSSIPNNADPGDTYNGPAIISPTTSPCDRREEVSEQVGEYLEEAEEFCTPNIPDLGGSERINLLGGLAECVDTCSGQTQPGTRCHRFAGQVFADAQSIQLPSAPERTLGSRTFNGLTAPIQLAAIDPVNGQVIRVDIPADGEYAFSVESGIMTLAPQSPGTLIYTTPKSIASGNGSSSSFSLNGLSGVTVPDWATHAIVEVRASIYSLGGQTQSNEISSATVQVNGRLVARAGNPANWGSNVFQMDPTSTDTNTVYAQLNSGAISYAIEQIVGNSRNPIFDCYVKLVGFTNAQIEP